MYSVTDETQAASAPSDTLHLALTFKRRADGLGPTKVAGPLSMASIADFEPEAIDMDYALRELSRRGFRIDNRGRYTATARISREQYERLFGTKLEAQHLADEESAQYGAFYYPPEKAMWNPDPDIMRLIDDAYIQWPHIYMGRASVRRRPAPPLSSALLGGAAPPAPSQHHLTVPHDLVRLLNVGEAHNKGYRGRGMRVAMIDSGFDHGLPFFAQQNVNSSVVLAPGATNKHTDRNGHGTGESANIFAVAPEVTFIGVKVDNDVDASEGASVLDGFLEALKHKPHVISVSLGYDLRNKLTGQQLTSLPNGLKPLAIEIQGAIADGVIVVFSAGNGHYAFPGALPELISAGGAYVDHANVMQASDYASAFPSTVFPGRHVPDVCGLVGMKPHADYIMLPIPPGCEIDRSCSFFDGTTPSDGWALFSGTSAAAPQIAGVCALLKQANPGLTPEEVKQVLRRTAKDVVRGRANSFSDAAGLGLAAGPGNDGATGAGLIDVAHALRQV